MIQQFWIEQKMYKVRIKDLINENIEIKESMKRNQKKISEKVEKEKPPEAAADLLGDVMEKFKKIEKKDKEVEKKNLFEAKRAFSEEK